MAKPSSKIDLESVYLAVKDGPLFGSFDKQPFKPCPVSCHIGEILENTYSDLEEHLRNRMRKIKLSKIVEEIRSRK